MIIQVGAGGAAMTKLRPILISTVQYDAELTAGTLRSLDVIEVAKRRGVDGVELREGYWRDKDREIATARRRLDELNLIATYATNLALFSSADQIPLRRAVDDAVALGTSLVRVFPGAVPPDADRAAWSAAHEAVGYAAERGTVLALENFGRAPGCHLAEVVSVLDRIDSPSLGTNVDIGNYAANGEDAVAAVRALAGRIVSTHLRDQVETPAGLATTYLGGGALPLPAILAELARLPQKVVYCFEFEGSGDPEGRIAQSLSYLRNLAGGME
jgi:sugar phosphate isomerase/epimerase